MRANVSDFDPPAKAPADAGAVTRLLAAARGGDSAAPGKLFEIVYADLRELAEPERQAALAQLAEQDPALAAYRRLLEQDKVPLDALIRQQLETQIALVAASADVATVEPMRNPWLE